MQSSHRSRRIFPKDCSLWRAHTTTECSWQELQPVGKLTLELRKSVRRKKQLRALHVLTMLPCWGVRSEGVKLSLGKGGGQVLFYFIYLFSFSFLRCILIGNNFNWFSLNWVCFACKTFSIPKVFLVSNLPVFISASEFSHPISSLCPAGERRWQGEGGGGCEWATGWAFSC